MEVFLTFLFIVGFIILFVLYIKKLFKNRKNKSIEQVDSPTLDYINNMMNSELMLSPENITNIINFSKNANDDSFDSEEKVVSKLSDFIDAWNIRNGLFPEQSINFIPQKNEKGIYSNNCEVRERKQVTTRINYAGPRLRVKIAKGLSYNMGSANVSTQKQLKDISHGNGIMNITTKRVLFQSTQKTISIPFNSLLNIELYSDGIIIYKNTGNPLIFLVSDATKLYLYLNAAIKS